MVARHLMSATGIFYVLSAADRAHRGSTAGPTRRQSVAVTWHAPIELEHRTEDGLEVTLLWVRGQGADRAVVCVCDTRAGEYFEIPAEPYLALDVFQYPLAYRDFSTVAYRDGRLAA